MKKHTRDNVTYIEVEPGDLPERLYTHKLAVGRRVREPNKGRFWIEIHPRAVEILGRHGLLLAQSKTAYAIEHPGHQILFNACVFTTGGTEIWFGDLDVHDQPTLGRLGQLAAEVGTIYVTSELPFRWRGLPRSRRQRLKDHRIRCFQSGRRR